MPRKKSDATDGAAVTPDPDVPPAIPEPRGGSTPAAAEDAPDPEPGAPTPPDLPEPAAEPAPAEPAPASPAGGDGAEPEPEHVPSRRRSRNPRPSRSTCGRRTPRRARARAACRRRRGPRRAPRGGGRPLVRGAGADLPLDPDRRRGDRRLGRAEARAALAGRPGASGRVAGPGPAGERGAARRARGAARRRARRARLAPGGGGDQRRRGEPHRRGGRRRSTAGSSGEIAALQEAVGQLDGADTRQRLARLEIALDGQAAEVAALKEQLAGTTGAAAASETQAGDRRLQRRARRGCAPRWARSPTRYRGSARASTRWRPRPTARSPPPGTRRRPTETELGQAGLEADLALVRAAIFAGVTVRGAAGADREPGRGRAGGPDRRRPERGADAGGAARQLSRTRRTPRSGRASSPAPATG